MEFKHMKKFEDFSPMSPAPSPITKPTTAPPKTEPGRRDRPSPIRRDKPEVSPAPKAKSEDVAKRFILELNRRGESVKKYLKK